MSARWFFLGVVERREVPRAAGWQELDRYLLSRNVCINCPPEDWQTTGGVHAATSFHYQGLARDYSVGMGCDEAEIVRALLPLPPPKGRSSSSSTPRPARG